MGEDPVPGDAGIPTIKNFHFSNVRVTDVPVLVDGTAIHPAKPLDGFTLENVSGTCGKGIFLANIKNASCIKKVEVSGFKGAFLSIANVTGTGLAGATTSTRPNSPTPSPPRRTRSEFHRNHSDSTTIEPEFLQVIR